MKPENSSENTTPKRRWEHEVVTPTLRKAAERRPAFTTMSGVAVERLYAPEDVARIDYERDVHDPGGFPYVRGVAHGGPTDQLAAAWAMRQAGGLGSPEDANRRYRELLAAGSNGLTVTFDAPTRLGLDPDDARARGAVGRGGVSVASLADLERLYDGIALADVTTSMAIDAPAAPLLAMYLALAERQGVDWASLTGAIQHDVLGDRLVGQASLFPLASSMRLVADTAAFCVGAVPRWIPVTASGYGMREAGATAVQELAFTLAAAIAYVRHAVDAGVDVDAIAPRVAVVFSVHSDFFEEIAKLRAARKLWAEAMRDGCGAKDPQSWQLRVHTHTANVSLTAAQPYNNVVRTALQALSAVLGGTNVLQTSAFDEAFGAPAKDAATLALRTQQIVAHESAVAAAIDPLGGSYFVETLTQQMEQGARACWDALERAGGLASAIEQGYPRQEIAAAAQHARAAVEQKERVVVGVNDFVQAEDGRLDTTAVDEACERTQVEQLQALRASRNAGAVTRALEALRQAARGTDNVMPALIDSARAYATLGEMSGALRDVWG